MGKLKSVKKSCHGTKTDGSRCQVAALPGSEFCFFHDPDRAGSRREAQVLGGSQNRIKTLDAATPDIVIEDCQDVVRLISLTINQVRKGQLDPRVANAIGYLANILVRAVEQGETEKRLDELESIVKKPRTLKANDLALMGG